MNILPDDPKLTAFALGELDPVEAKQIQIELDKNPELREVVKEIRQTAELLKKEFANELTLSFSQTEKETIVAKIEAAKIISFPNIRFWTTAGISAIAASVVIVLSWQGWFRPTKQDMTFAEGKVLVTNDSIAPVVTPSPKPTPLDLTISRPVSDKGLIAARPIAKEAKPNAIPTGRDNFAVNQVKGLESLVPGLINQQANRVVIQEGGGQGGGGSKTEQSKVAPNPSGSVASRYGGRLGNNLGLSGEGLRSIPTVESTPPATPSPSSSVRLLVEADSYLKRSGEDGYSLRLEPEMIEKQRQGTARYPKYAENDFQSVLQEPLSTFSIDVDSASYANVRRFLNENRLPPKDAVRIEELINYFSYSYPQPKGDEPFSANVEVAGCPWNSQHRLVRIGLKGKEIAQDKRPPSNFVFLIDVSGSMSPSERLPLIKQALRMLVKRMTENDRIAIVVYASSSGVVLESTSCANKEKILEALDRLEAGGSTNGGEGVQRAYALAEENFIKGGVNRVILCTDGDFNVGITDQSELVNLIQRKAKSGVFLSALGVGTDNYKDALMQKLADKGNGNYHYIDTMEEAHKVLIQQMNGTLVTIAKDVKIQIEFNPAQVSSYRLIGYEKRILAAEDFNNDKKDAGEIGAGHTVTALYEIVPANGQEDGPRAAVDDLKYQKPVVKSKREIGNNNPELLTLKLRYKKSDGSTSKLSETTVTDSGKNFSQASSDFKFASAVAGFGMILKNSEHKGELTFKSVLDVAEKSKGDDKEGYRAEFINLVKKAKSLHQRE